MNHNDNLCYGNSCCMSYDPSSACPDFTIDPACGSVPAVSTPVSVSGEDAAHVNEETGESILDPHMANELALRSD